MLEIRFYPADIQKELKYAVIGTEFEGKPVWCRHRDRTTWEMPGGHIEAGESALDAAKRELKEETGAVPGELRSLGRILPSPGCFSETLHMFLARDLRMEEQALDPGEFLNVERIPFDEMVRRCLDGDIEDAKTVTAVLKAKLMLDL